MRVSVGQSKNIRARQHSIEHQIRKSHASWVERSKDLRERAEERKARAAKILNKPKP